MGLSDCKNLGLAALQSVSIQAEQIFKTCYFNCRSSLRPVHSSLCTCGCLHSEGIILACATRLQVEHVLLTQSSWRKLIPTKGGFASACMRT